ncbi:hypothetical protein AAY473_016855, partial [Plecturocebus cupreus]
MDVESADLAEILAVDCLAGTLSHRLEYSGIIMAHCNICLLDSSKPPTLASKREGFTMSPRLVSNSWAQAIPSASASQSAGIIGRSHHVRPTHIYYFEELVKMHEDDMHEACLELLYLGSSPALASQKPGITDMSHFALSSTYFCLNFPPDTF